MSLFRKIIQTVQSYWYGLFYGMKQTNDTVFTQAGIDNSIGTEIQQEVNENRVSKDLLKGEVTQQVEELRYRTYKVDRESKQYEYFSPVKALKYETPYGRFERQDSNFVKYENSEDLPVITIQPNNPCIKNVYDGIKDINFDTVELKDKQGNICIDVGDFSSIDDYTIKVERDFTPRFKLENFTTRLVVKKLDDNDNMILDFYVSKYPKEQNMKSIYFVNEVEKIFNGNTQSDVLSLKRVMFTTSHAYRLEDMIEFRFDKIFYKGIVEYDGHYVLKFKAHAYVNGVDLTDEYYSKSMDEKYRNKEKKEVVLDAYDGGNRHETFVCAECGRTFEYDTESMNEETLRPAREIDEEITNDGNDVLSFYDLQIAEQTFGKKLCKECLQKYLNNNINSLK